MTSVFFLPKNVEIAWFEANDALTFAWEFWVGEDRGLTFSEMVFFFWLAPPKKCTCEP